MIEIVVMIVLGAISLAVIYLRVFWHLVRRVRKSR